MTGRNGEDPGAAAADHCHRRVSTPHVIALRRPLLARIDPRRDLLDHPQRCSGVSGSRQESARDVQSDDEVSASSGSTSSDAPSSSDGDAVGVASGSSASVIARSRAAIVAASTVPVGFTPSSAWNAFSASVRAGVHSPSTGPVQKPARLRVCCTAAVVAIDCCSAAPPCAGQVGLQRRSGRGVDGSRHRQPVDSWRAPTASTVAGP